ncbi:VUT family protein [Rariglobus hedericola]|uniref:Probable queuosine precursor transporter n=1 Tax=Rariglobus hedericola TaxID=2597822 RepID=A0A556QSR4_9BACT|nr:VUT family protein [Rariglobus hedericola]TSJ79680.1 VUT family protein [Rariglobus hedericola]
MIPAETDSISFRRLLLPVLAMAAIVLLSNVLVQYPITDWLTWGAFSYPITYFVTDVCNRWAGPRLARRVAWAGFVTGAIASVSVALGQDDPAFGLRIAGASGTAFIVSQLLDVAIFNRLRRQSWWKAPLWGSAIASTVDTAIFFSLAFAGTGFDWKLLAAGDLGVKLLMAAALLVPFRALVRRLAPTG